MGLIERLDSDGLSRLAGTRPELFGPHQETVIGDGLLERLELSFDDQCVLFAGASDRCVRMLAGRLRRGESFTDSLALGAIGTPAALAAIADDVRDGGDREVYADSGFWIPPAGPAVPRFSIERRAVFLSLDASPGPVPSASPDAVPGVSLGSGSGASSDAVPGVPLGPGSGAEHPVGLPVERVMAGAAGPVAWHYLSLRLAAIPGLPAWPASHAHLVAPRSTGLWTLFATAAPDGRYRDARAVLDEPDDDTDFFQDDPSFGRGQVLLRPYGPELDYSNGHIQSTPGVVGTAGGPPIGLYPNPACRSCDRLMFHVATVSSMVREHGDGPRGLYLCEDCVTVAVTSTPWN